MKPFLALITALLICGCAAQTSRATVEEPSEEQIRQARVQTALRRLGEEREGVRQAGAETYVVICGICISDSVCDADSKQRVLEMRDQACPSGKGHMTSDAVGTVRTARACTAKCYKFEMPTNSYVCD